MQSGDLDRFKALMDELAEVFGKKTDDLIQRRYFDVLRDLDFSTVEREARAHMKDGKFFPKPRDLRPRDKRKPADSDERGGKYPEPFTPAWNEMRRQIMAGIAKQSRERGIEWTDEQRRQSKLALDLAVLSPGMVGYDEARIAFQNGNNLARLIAENVRLPENRERHIMAPQYVPHGSPYLQQWRAFCEANPIETWPLWLQGDRVARSFVQA